MFSFVSAKLILPSIILRKIIYILSLMNTWIIAELNSTATFHFHTLFYRLKLTTLVLYLAVPCVPTNVSVVMHCANNTALVSWSASRGAVQYSVTARSSHSNTSCQTSDLSCRLKNLTCGSSYTVQVAAMDDNCSSIPSQVVAFNSGETYTTNEQLQFHILVLCKPNVQSHSWVISSSSYSQAPAHPRMWVLSSTVPQTTWRFPGMQSEKRTTFWFQ